MNKQFTILHISDLHKPKNCNLDTLFYSLQTDCEAYTKEGLSKTEIIVVSGDIAEGTKNDGIQAKSIIRSQYAEAKRFLENLTNYFLNGERGRLVMVPGNHDCCFKDSKESMTLSPEVNAKDDFNRFKTADPDVRWNWEDRHFYHITNNELYETRFDLFREFYDDFYAGIRNLPEDICRSSYIVEVDNYQTAFVCFNSCHRLDHLNPMGCICPDAVALAHPELLRLKNMGYLLVGVWHHHVSGLPVENNYMDHRILDAMMSEDIKVGLFGHQHVSTAIQEYSDITSKQSILLISSGSLYGNSHQLVTGVPRQYNVIGVEFDSDKVTLQLNVRKDNSQYGYDIPQWMQSSIGIKNLPNYKHELHIERPKIESVVEDIEKMVMNTQNYDIACVRLKEAGLDHDLVLKYFDSYVSKMTDKTLLKQLLVNPMTSVQYMTALDTAVSSKDREWILTLLKFDEFQTNATPYVKELLEQAKKLI